VSVCPVEMAAADAGSTLIPLLLSTAVLHPARDCDLDSGTGANNVVSRQLQPLAWRSGLVSYALLMRR
jgi:hypothetical protein